MTMDRHRAKSAPSMAERHDDDDAVRLATLTDADGPGKWAFTILAVSFGALTAGLLVAGNLMTGNNRSMSGSGASASAGMQGLDIRFTDPAWDGRTVPANALCSRYGPAGKSPGLAVSGLPADTRMVVIAFNDDSYQRLSTDGGHGTIAMPVPTEQSWVAIPPVAGESHQLPADIIMVKPHRGALHTGTAYLPPCSGGAGNHYSAVVQAVRTPPPGPSGTVQIMPEDVLAQATISLGRY
ncbi:hypothetical protein P7L64_23645 [Tistrella bauzanensis]|nr:hypothetical protein [Tistrella bauzanensis]